MGVQSVGLLHNTPPIYSHQAQSWTDVDVWTKPPSQRHCHAYGKLVSAWTTALIDLPGRIFA
jgi:hypothetical protein